MGSYGRKLGSKISELQMDVKTKEQENQTVELRLQHMEQDMVEMSAQNENYRSQVMNLTTQVDIAETQMRALRDQDSWIGTDLQDFQRLNDELSQQKEELQKQIALQAQEI